MAIPPDDPFEKKLRQLLERGSLPSSSLSKRQRHSLRPLFETGILEERVSGPGVRLEVTDRQALLAFAKSLFPRFEEQGSSSRCGLTNLTHAHGVMLRRDAKTASCQEAIPVLLRGFGQARLVSSEEGSRFFDVSWLTQVAGLAAILVTSHTAWKFTGKVAIVENMEVFLNVERILGGLDLCIYGGGRMPGLVLSWLSSCLFHGCRFVHLPDYDPVGLSEYLRLKRVLGSHIGLFVPDHLKKLLETYGKRELLSSQARLIQGLRNCGVQEVERIIRMCEEYGAGLEQEILLLEPGSRQGQEGAGEHEAYMSGRR